MRNPSTRCGPRPISWVQGDLGEGLGVGTALLEALDGRARASGARCLWLETQSINYPAIRFYRRSGFRLCGLDDTLYDPERDPTTGPDEVALFFTRPL